MSTRAVQESFLLAALRRGDPAAAESAAWLLLSDGTSLTELYDEVLRPFFVELGTAYERGELRLADEHLASRAAIELVTLLGQRQLLAGGKPRGCADRGTIVLGAVPGEQHMLGARMLAQVLQSRGWAAQVLDALPFPALASYCRSLPRPPEAVGLTLHEVPSLAVLRTGIAALRQALPDVPVVLGGTALAAHPGLPAKVGASGGASTLAGGADLLDEVSNPLTRRERQILELVAGGASNAEIASALSVHSSTVKTHLEHVADKLGTSDRTAAAVQGLRRGWID